MKTSVLQQELLSLRVRRPLVAALLSVACIAIPYRAAASDYTDDLPSVARVEAEIRGSDATDTLARQVAVFTYLESYIDRTKSARSFSGPYTPGESRMYNSYRNAAYRISQDYAKAHTPDQARAFERLHGQYEMDEKFTAAWQKSLIGPQAAAAYSGAVNSLAAGQRAHVAQEQEQYQQDVAAQQAGPDGNANDPTRVATRRCLELGGDPTACLGKGMASGIISLFTGGASTGLSDLTGPGRSGIVLSGNYRSATTSINFGPGSAGIDRCADLVEVPAPYTIRKSAAGAQIVLEIAPRPISLSMHSDGSLLGPGLTVVTGQVIVGYHTVTTTQMINGVRAAPGQCRGPCQTITRVPNYAPKTVRCSIASFAPPPPAPPNAAAAQADDGIIGAIGGMMNTVSPASEPGLRMEGKYFSPSGLILDFAGDAVTMDCGQAHVKAPYTVVNSASSFTIDVKNPGGPFALTVLSNNTLSGTGSTTVHGRLVSGMDGDNVTFAPHSESCRITTLTPQSAESSSSVEASTTPAGSPAGASANAAPVAPSASQISLTITSTFPIAANPLAGKRVMLMTAPFNKVMSDLGAPIPAGTTPGQALQAWASACSPPKNCSARAKQIATYEVGAGNFDNAGKVSIRAPIAPGTYYVFCSVRGTRGVLVWDLPAALRDGDNSIHLTAANAELVPIPPAQ